MAVQKSQFLQTFFCLLQDALWRNGEDLSKEYPTETITRLFALAEQQAVSGLLIDALIRHDVKMPQQWVLEAIGLLEQIKQQSRLVNHGVCELHHLLSREGINYVVVKGQAVASYYPEPLIRQSGDIDYYCSLANYTKSLEIVKHEWGIVPESEITEKHCHYEYKEVIYEGHFNLLSLYDKTSRLYWQQLLDNDKGGSSIIDGLMVKTLSPTLHVLYVFLHLYNHLMKLGVGLRQFCDMAVMLHYCKVQIDIEALKVHLKALGMERAYRACGSILIEYLGLPQEDLGYTLSDVDRKYGERILDVVIYRGNMGHYNKRNGFRGWKHKLEALGIKVSHFIKFMPLAPGYSRGWLWHEISRQAK